MTQRKKTYLTNKDRKVGDKCVCPICKCEFIKTHYAQAFCCNECKVKYHNDKQRGKRNGYFRKYNMKHPERYDRVGIDLEFEKWKTEYYADSYANMLDGETPCEIDREYLISLYEEKTGNMYRGV